MADGAEKLRERIERIRERIDGALTAAGRSDRVYLCAASKTQDAETVRSAAPYVDMFGENRVQELTAKLAQNAYGGKPAHFVGHLQTNKVRQVVGSAELIHSVDSLRLAESIDREAQKRGLRQDVLIEINVSAEASKSGIAPEEILSFVESAASFSALNIRGLMAIPPKSEFPGQNRRYFETLFKLFIDIKAKKYDNVNMDYLSMGMSEDYYDAILSGANIVRIGSAIFGPRK